MGNPQSTKLKPDLVEPINVLAEIVESAESDSIDIAMMPSNNIFTGLKHSEDFSSEPFSNVSSSEIAINNCFQNGNILTEISLTFNNEVEKQVLKITGDFAESLCNGMLNRSIMISEIPMDGQYSDL